MNLEDHIEHLPRALVPRVLTVHGKFSGPNLYRCWWPSGFCSTKGFVADFCDYPRFDEQHAMIEAGRYNMIVTPRIAFATERLFKMWRDVVRDTGLAWVYDSDDDLWSPEFPERQENVFRDMPDQAMTRKEYELERLQRIYALERVDAVTVTTPRLAKIAAKYTDAPVHVLPNLVNVAAFEAGLTTRRRDVQPLTVGWSGTKRQDDDLEQVAAAWHIIAERNPAVKFVIQGWHSFALASAVPLDRLYVLRGVKVEEYPAVLRNLDIACCAVSSDPWNLGKSAVKFFEASLAGSACVVSRHLYGDYVDHGRTALVADSVDDWVTHIQQLIDDEQYRRSLQRNARNYVIANHSLEQHWREWVSIWARILDDKRTLVENHHASDARTELGTRASAEAR